MKRINIILIVIILLSGCTSTEINKSKNLKEKEEYYIIKGMNYERDNSYTKALKEYEKAYKLNKNNIITLKDIAGIYTKLKDYDNGIFYYEKALKLDERDNDVIRNISFVYFLKKDYKKSLEYIGKIPYSDKNVESLKLESYLLYMTKNYEKSYDIFQMVLKENSEIDISYYEIYLNLLEKLNKKNEMRIFLENNLIKNRNNEKYVIFYANSLKNYFDEYSLGEKELKRYIVTYGGNDDVYLTLAEIFYEEQKTDKSKEILNFISNKGRYSEKYLYLKERLN